MASKNFFPLFTGTFFYAEMDYHKVLPAKNLVGFSRNEKRYVGAFLVNKLKKYPLTIERDNSFGVEK